MHIHSSSRGRPELPYIYETSWLRDDDEGNKKNDIW